MIQKYAISRIFNLILIFLCSLIIYSCSNISVNQEDLQRMANRAVHEVNKKAISGKYFGSSYWANTKVTFDKFDQVEMESDGVKTKAIPLKIKSTSIICFYNDNWFGFPTTSYTTIDNEVTIYVYRNEVKDLKYKIVDDKSTFGNQNDYKGSSRSIVRGTIKKIDIESSTFLMNTGEGEFRAMILDDNMGKLISNYFKVGDLVTAHVDKEGANAWGFNRVLYLDPK